MSNITAFPHSHVSPWRQIKSVKKNVTGVWNLLRCTDLVQYWSNDKIYTRSWSQTPYFLPIFKWVVLYFTDLVVRNKFKKKYSCIFLPSFVCVFICQIISAELLGELMNEFISTWYTSKSLCLSLLFRNCQCKHQGMQAFVRYQIPAICVSYLNNMRTCSIMNWFNWICW